MIAIPLEIGNYDKEKTSYLDKVENNVIEKIPIKAELEVKNLSNHGILLPKLFWTTVRKIVLVIEKIFWNLKLIVMTDNLQNFWDH